MTLGLQNDLAPSRPPWEQSPRTLISLWDMKEFFPINYLQAIVTIEAKIKEFKEAAKRNPSGMLQEVEKEQVLNAAKFYTAAPMDSLGLDLTRDAVLYLELRIRDLDGCSYTTAAERLLVLVENHTKEMKARMFAFVEHPEYFRPANINKRDNRDGRNIEPIFGGEVESKFPEAAQDIEDAGNCLAVGLTTSAIFHLMRVAEVGLRYVANDLQVSFSGPIEFQTWGDVIREIEAKLKAIKGTTKDYARERRIQFYSALVPEIKAFQFAWRDPISHARTRFDDCSDGEKVFNHVRRFMETLASQAS